MGDAAAGCQTSNAYARYATSYYRKVVVCERGVDIVPEVSWFDGGDLLVPGKTDLLHLLKSDGDAAINARSTSKCGMAPTSHGEGTLREAR